MAQIQDNKNDDNGVNDVNNNNAIANIVKPVSEIIIAKRNFDPNKYCADVMVNGVMSNINITKLPFFVIDVHNTMEYTDINTRRQCIDNDVLQYIIKLDNKGYSLLFLSFDGNEKRAKHNANFLNKSSPLLSKMNKIFIKLRKKGLILHYIQQYLSTKYKALQTNNQPNIIFIDDNASNMHDARNYLKIPKELQIFKYSKHSKWDNDYNDFAKMYNIFTPL